jgi:hypothetical protein
MANIANTNIVAKTNNVAKHCAAAYANTPTTRHLSLPQQNRLIFFARHVYQITLTPKDVYLCKIIQYDWPTLVSSLYQSEPRVSFSSIVKELCPPASGGKKKKETLYGKNVDQVRTMFKTFCAHIVIGMFVTLMSEADFRLIIANLFDDRIKDNEKDCIKKDPRLLKFTTYLKIVDKYRLIPLKGNQCLIDALTLLEEEPPFLYISGTRQSNDRSVRVAIYLQVAGIQVQTRRKKKVEEQRAMDTTNSVTNPLMCKRKAEDDPFAEPEFLDTKRMKIDNCDLNHHTDSFSIQDAEDNFQVDESEVAASNFRDITYVANYPTYDTILCEELLFDSEMGLGIDTATSSPLEHFDWQCYSLIALEELENDPFFLELKEIVDTKH